MVRKAILAEVPHPLTAEEIDKKLQDHHRTEYKQKKLVQQKIMAPSWKTIKQSEHSKNTVNPIRKIADAMNVKPNPEKELIKLHLGDPSLSSKMPTSRICNEALEESLKSAKHNGYGPAVGEFAARAAVAKRYTHKEAPLTADDIVLASGCSHAIQMAIEALADAGDNILIPHPGFPLYSTLCRPHGIEDRAYKLDLKNGGSIDLVQMETLIDERTKAIVINNPGNPTGVVFKRDHLIQILEIASRYRVPIIADEIYGDLVYDGAEFIPMATLSPKVPILSCDGIAKRWMVPGWRLGWVSIHDRFGALSDVRKGLTALSQKIVGPCSLVQGALPKILAETPEEYFQYNRNVLSANARAITTKLGDLPGIHILKPQGAMYMMIGIDKAIYGEDVTFVQQLIEEESVFCFPGSAFSAPGWIRIVITYSEEEMSAAAQRIREFCERRLGHETSESLDSSDEGCDISTSESE